MDTAPYRDSEQSIDRRVDDLLDRMTIEEKVGQVVETYHGEHDDVDAMNDLISEYHLGAVGPIEGEIVIL